MGSGPARPNVKIDFREHLKTQRELIFDEEVTKGARPSRGHAMQSGQRSRVYHINHETFDPHHVANPLINADSFAPTHNIRNPHTQPQGKLDDNRKEAPSKDYPYSCIGMLHVQFENRRKRGTAFLISSNWVLTCAHNFYDRTERKRGTNATFLLSLEEREERTETLNEKSKKQKVDYGEEIQISDWRIPEEFINGSDEEAELYDFALVKLKNFYNLEQKYGYFGLDSVWSFERAHTATKLIVAGYPLEVKGKEKGEKCKVLMEGRGEWTEILNEQHKKRSERLLYVNYNIFTSGGQSGSPIFYETKDKEYFMIGIHTLGSDEENSGVLVTPKTRSIINGWIEEMKRIFDISNRNIGNDGMKDFISNFIQISDQITELQLANNRIGPEGIAFLMKTKWTNLKLLNLENNNIKLEGARILANPTNGWNSLEYLNLNNTMIGDEGCCALLQKRKWTKLKDLHLKRCSLTTRTAKELVESEHEWINLETLNLGMNELTSSDIHVLFTPLTQGRNRFSQLRNLNLSKNKIGNDGLKVIVECQFDLVSLSITGIGMTHEGMALLASRMWKRLQKLYIDWNKEVSIEGIKHLTPHCFPALSNVNLDWTTLGGQGIRQLMGHPWKTLKNLSLNHNYLGDQGIKDLQSHGTIEVLVLQGNNITTEGIKAFASNDQWKNLLQLKLRSNHIQKGGFSEVIKNLKALNYLDINNNGLDAHHKRELKQEAVALNPNLHIEVDMGEEADYT